MTAQIAEQLENQNSAVDFGGLQLYRVVTGDIETNHGWGEPYVFSTKPQVPEDNMMCSALWRGYVGCYRLYADGSLKLVSYQFPFSESCKATQQRVCEVLKGKFFLVMKQSFFAPRTYVPFVGGKIVSDPSQWTVEPRAQQHEDLDFTGYSILGSKSISSPSSKDRTKADD